MIFIANTIKQLLISTVLGILISYICIKYNLTLEIEWNLFVIVIVSYLLGKIHQRFTCYAYVLTVVYILDSFFKFHLDYSVLMILTGMLHIVEGILTYYFGAISSEPLILTKEVKGYKSYEKWFVPLFLFKLQGIYVPLIAVTIYYNETFTYTAQEKAHKMGIYIGIFGLQVLFLTFLEYYYKVPLFICLIMMTVLHEHIFIIDAELENKIY